MATAEVRQHTSSGKITNKKNEGLNHLSLDYSTLRNLRASYSYSDPYEIKLLPGLGIKAKISYRNKKKELEP